MALPEPRQRKVREVVAAVRLPHLALDRLQKALGKKVHLVDITNSSPDAELVLCPPCSPQTISALCRQFPHARVVITELEDLELGVDTRGPVTRSLDAGASSYLIAGSVQHLAAMLRDEQELVDAHRREPLALPTPSVDDDILAALADLARHPSAVAQEQGRRGQ